MPKRGRPPLEWWQHLIQVGILVAAVAGLALVFVTDDSDQDKREARVSTTSTSTPAGPGTSTKAEPALTSSTVPGSLLLGRDVQPLEAKPCRAPGSADGSAWQFARVGLGAAAPADGYYCNVFSGGTGQLTFPLNAGFRRFTVDIGFVNNSPATDHVVDFEVIADNTRYVSETSRLAFGQTRRIDADVTGVSQLTLKITEVRRGGNDAASRPVWLNPFVVKGP